MSDESDREAEDATAENLADVSDDTTRPHPSDIPAPTDLGGVEAGTGYVVWHRKHLRLTDHRALSRAIAEGDAVCPLFVFDPAFYSGDGLACDARIRFLHEAVASLNRLYAAAPKRSVLHTTTHSTTSLTESTPAGSRPSAAATGAGRHEASLGSADESGLTVGFGDPVDLLSRFVDRGWSVLTMATPTSRYGHRRDERVRAACGDAVTFVSGDGLVRDREWPRADWQSHVEDWLTASPHTPAWDDHDTVRLTIETGVTPAAIDDKFDIAPAKAQVPPGTHRAATTRLREFVDQVPAYPTNISAPQDAREGTSGLSPYLNFGLLSIRQAYQHVLDNAPSCRGRSMFTDRLVWNMHYNQKLSDWPGWTERAVNPVFEGRNEDRHDPELVAAWKNGETGFPMVDAAMRCLRRTGWLNFRMRAMCASFFTHILHQPWWIGADWYHHHLIDSDVGINYTQWQSQAGLIGKPSQRVYNPRKQVRDHDADGVWITRWVPELQPLPSQFLARPERTPLAVQQECGVTVGEDYPSPVVDFEARRQAFWTRHERRRSDAARELRRPEIAKRASFSGGYGAAQAIADEYGRDGTEDGTQLSLGEIDDGGDEATSRDRPVTGQGDANGTEGAVAEGPSTGDGTRSPMPTGVGSDAGEPAPDDETAVPDDPADDGNRDDHDGNDDTSSAQTSIQRFE